MAEQQGKRWVLIKMLHHAVERTEEQVAELKAAGLFVRDASGPDDSHGAAPKADSTPPAVPAKPAA